MYIYIYIYIKKHKNELIILLDEAMDNCHQSMLHHACDDNNNN